MIQVVLFLITVALIAAGFAWVADRPGDVAITWMGYQVDVDLLLRVAEACPDCTLVLVGPDCLPDDARRRALHAMANVTFLGQKALESLPEYLKVLDVALIPYVIGGHTLTVYPLKLHEYLAAGRPIVASPLPELKPFSQVVRIAESAVDFVRQIREAIADHSPTSVAARVAVARENTWDSRVTDIYRAIDKRLSRGREGQREEHIHLVDTLRPAQ